MSYVRQVGHGGAIGIAYHAHGDDWVELSLPYDERLIGMAETGIIASGPIISLMDMATSLAIWIRLGRFRHQATLDLGSIISARRRPAARSSAAASATARPAASASSAALAHDGDADDPVANVTGTFMFTE